MKLKSLLIVVKDIERSRQFYYPPVKQIFTFAVFPCVDAILQCGQIISAPIINLYNIYMR